MPSSRGLVVGRMLHPPKMSMLIPSNCAYESLQVPLAVQEVSEWQNWNGHSEKFERETNCSYMAESHMRRESNAVHAITPGGVGRGPTKVLWK